MFAQYGDLVDGFKLLQGTDIQWSAVLSISCIGNSVILWLVTVMVSCSLVQLMRHCFVEQLAWH